MRSSFSTTRACLTRTWSAKSTAASKCAAAAGEFGDFELAANALGVCDAAVENAMQFARSERRGGKLLYEHQLVQLKLNEMHALTEALRSYVLRTGWEMDHKVQGVNAVLVMNYSTTVIQRVTELNMDIHGGSGLEMDAYAEKLVRDAMIWTHLAGDSVTRMKAIQHFLKPHALPSEVTPA